MHAESCERFPRRRNVKRASRGDCREERRAVLGAKVQADEGWSYLPFLISGAWNDILNFVRPDVQAMKSRFYMVDVFAERLYAGNQLAVVIDADDLSCEARQRFAAEMNYSETTFVDSAPQPGGGHRVRIFTPAREIAFAGHPILGTAWVVRHHVAPEIRGTVSLNLAIGQVTVTFESSSDGLETAWFLAPPISLGATCAPERMATAIGVRQEDIETKVPVQQCSAGTSAMIVPLRSLAALRRSRLNLEAYAPLADEGFPPLVYAFCTETNRSENNLCARFFFEAHGVREDPATGNGSAFLGTYLLEHRFFPEADLFLRIEQGYEIRRPSLIFLRARIVDGLPEVRVGGRVIPVLQGELF